MKETLTILNAFSYLWGGNKRLPRIIFLLNPTYMFNTEYIVILWSFPTKTDNYTGHWTEGLILILANDMNECTIRRPTYFA